MMIGNVLPLLTRMALLMLPVACIMPGAAVARDFSPIHGSWQGTHTPCRQISDDTWQIDATGASAYESSCRVRSVTRQGNRFTLRQRCQYFEEFANETTVFRLVNRNELEIEGRRYRRCGR